jgi:hypothetical protein
MEQKITPKHNHKKSLGILVLFTLLFVTLAFIEESQVEMALILLFSGVGFLFLFNQKARNVIQKLL